MRLVTWNVNSLVPTVRNINLKYGSLAAFFAHLNADIVCMQEVKLPEAKLTKDLVVVEGYQSYWCCSQGKTGYSGVTTWAKEGFAAVSAEAEPFTCEGCEREGRALITDHGSFVLFNVYVPNAGDRPARARLGAKLAFLAALKERVDDLLGSGRQVIIVGDLNVASEKRDVHDAITWDTLYDPAELTVLHNIMDATGSHCTDAWRHFHPDTEGVYTVWDEKRSSRAFNVGLRIDYALVSQGLLGKALSCDVLLDLPPKWSDHAPVLLELDLQPPTAAEQQPEAPGAASASTGASGASTSQELPQKRPPECPMWQQLLKRFQDPSQRSIASMFKAASKSKATAAAAAKLGVSAMPSKSQSAGTSTTAATVSDTPSASAAAPGAVAGRQQSSQPTADAAAQGTPAAAAAEPVADPDAGPLQERQPSGAVADSEAAAAGAQQQQPLAQAVEAVAAQGLLPRKRPHAETACTSQQPSDQEAAHSEEHTPASMAVAEKQHRAGAALGLQAQADEQTQQEQPEQQQQQQQQQPPLEVQQQEQRPQTQSSVQETRSSAGFSSTRGGKKAGNTGRKAASGRNKQSKDDPKQAKLQSFFGSAPTAQKPQS